MKRDLCQTLDEKITPFMEELGFTFRKSKRRYSRPVGEAIQVVVTDVLAYPGGSYRIASHCGLTFPRLVEACFQHHTYGQRMGRTDFIMLTFNCDGLYRPDVSANLNLSADDLTSAIHNLRIGIEQDVIPFLDKYSDLPTLISNLEDIDWRNRINSAPLSRATVRLTYHALANAREAFDAASDDLRKYLGTPQGSVHASVMETLISGLETDNFKEAQQAAP